MIRVIPDRCRSVACSGGPQARTATDYVEARLTRFLVRSACVTADTLILFASAE